MNLLRDLFPYVNTQLNSFGVATLKIIGKLLGKLEEISINLFFYNYESNFSAILSEATINDRIAEYMPL